MAEHHKRVTGNRPTLNQAVHARVRQVSTDEAAHMATVDSGHVASIRQESATHCEFVHAISTVAVIAVLTVPVLTIAVLAIAMCPVAVLTITVGPIAMSAVPMLAVAMRTVPIAVLAIAVRAHHAGTGSMETLDQPLL